MLTSTHIRSLRTRAEIREVIEKYKLDSDDLRIYGLVDRQIRGCIHAKMGNVRIGWPDEVSKTIEAHFVCEVVSGRDINDAPKNKKEKWKRPYKIGARFEIDGEDEKVKYTLKEVGDELRFRMRYSTQDISAHSCEDILFQKGYKDIPTACYHICAVRYYLPKKLNDSIEENGENMIFTGDYEIGDELIDLYNEVYKHNLRAAQRLNILYACATGKLGSWRKGKHFLESVKDYINDPAIDWSVLEK